MATVDPAKIVKFVNTLCKRNLKNARVQCCAACPWKEFIVEQFPELGVLFEAKEAAVLGKGGRWG